jgi:hypothetical protein
LSGRRFIAVAGEDLLYRTVKTRAIEPMND